MLEAYARRGAYTDCYALPVAGQVSLERFVEAFYTTPVFKLERVLLALTLGANATDADARGVARGRYARFSAWRVEARQGDEMLLAAGRTRSWFKVEPVAGGGAARTVLLFGSAVVPRGRGGMGLLFAALLGFHKLYARVLLGAAGRRLASRARA